MSKTEQMIFYEDVLKVKYPKTKFTDRLNANYKEPLHVPLLTWQLYNWQYFTRRNHPTWVTHDGPPFTSGNAHLGTFYNKVSTQI
jgi:isoleucyl-tRNA synthetase